MFTFLGIVLILLGLVMLILRPFINKEDVYKTKTDMRGQEQRVLVGKKSAPFLLAITKKLAFIVLFVGLVLFAVPGIFFYAQPGMLYAVQYPTGGSKAVTQQGIKLKWWGKLIPIQMEIPIQDVLPDNETDHSPYAYIEKAQLREFNDAVKGTVANSIVVTVDYIAIDERTGKEKFLDVALKNRSQDNLVYSRIVPYRNAVLKNTAKLMSAQEYIAGGSAEFDRAFKDQLELGMYVLEEVINETVGDTIGQLHSTRIVGADQDGQIKKYKIRYGADKEPLRNEGALHEYGLSVQQAVVDKIDWEDNFDTRLDAQKAEVAATQLERQKAQKATEMKKRIIEEGESNKAEERAKLEKEQIQRTIAAETEVKENEFFLQAEKVKFEKSKIEVQARRILADVKKYEIEQANGLSEKEKYIIDKNVEKGIGVAKEVKDTKFPSFMYFGGGAGTGGTASNTPMIYDLLGAKLAESMFGPVTTNTNK